MTSWTSLWFVNAEQASLVPARVSQQQAGLETKIGPQRRRQTATLSCSCQVADAACAAVQDPASKYSVRVHMHLHTDADADAAMGACQAGICGGSITGGSSNGRSEFRNASNRRCSPSSSGDPSKISCKRERGDGRRYWGSRKVRANMASSCGT